jgi:hypothetical protein
LEDADGYVATILEVGVPLGVILEEVDIKVIMDFAVAVTLFGVGVINAELDFGGFGVSTCSIDAVSSGEDDAFGDQGTGAECPLVGGEGTDGGMSEVGLSTDDGGGLFVGGGDVGRGGFATGSQSQCEQNGESDESKHGKKAHERVGLDLCLWCVGWC